jgi:hypothetical protein
MAPAKKRTMQRRAGQSDARRRYGEILADLHRARARGPLSTDEESDVAAVLATLWDKLTKAEQREIENMVETYKREERGAKRPTAEAFQLSVGLLRACGMGPPKRTKKSAKLDPYRDRFLSSRRDLTLEEIMFAEDAQVLGAVAFDPTTLSDAADSLDGYEHTDAPDGSTEFYVIDWGGFDRASCVARRSRVRRALARLGERGLVRLVGRLWMATRAGAEMAGFDMKVWPRHVRTWRRERTAKQRLRRNGRRREQRAKGEATKGTRR